MTAEDFQEHMRAFQAFNQSKGLSQRTIEIYDGALGRFRRWFIETHGKEGEITARRIREFASCRLAAGNKPITVRSYLNSLRVFYAFLVLDEIIKPSENPMKRVQRIRFERPQIEPLSTEDVGRFLDTFDQGSLTDYRNYIICLLILDTGLRAGEVLGLTLEEIDLERGAISVLGKGQKKRTVYAGEKMRERLEDYLYRCRPWIANGHRVLFPPAEPVAKHKTITVRYFSTVIRRKLDMIGAKRMNSSTHRLRHTFAVMYLKNGGDAFSLQRLLGHSDLEMTKRYVMLADSDLQEAHRKASPVDRMEL